MDLLKWHIVNPQKETWSKARHQRTMSSFPGFLGKMRSWGAGVKWILILMDIWAVSLCHASSWAWKWKIGLFLRIDFKDKLAFVGLFTISTFAVMEIFVHMAGMCVIHSCQAIWICWGRIGGRSSLPTYSHVPVHCQAGNIQHLCCCGKFVFRHILVWNILKSCLENGWYCIQNHICSGLKPSSLLL